MNDSAPSVRVLLVADTHLGFDLPFRPRVKRRRRGPDFFANLERALDPALGGQVDLVVHGGDLFYRSQVPPALVEMAMAPLVRVAQTGVPVCLVPGNHERARIPLHLWSAHPNLYIFHRPGTFTFSLSGRTLAIAGFPFVRKVRDCFSQQVALTGYQDVTADARMLCLHQAVEGAQVGAHNFTFRRGPDIIAGAHIPGDFCAVLTGHIHRAQVLTHDMAGRSLAAPVIYPGSVERTSFAERQESKHYAVVTIRFLDPPRGQLGEVFFAPLPARPMVSLEVALDELDGQPLASHLKRQLAALEPDAVVRVRITGPGAEDVRQTLTAACLRELAPATMNVDLVPILARPEPVPTTHRSGGSRKR
jgi:DNA repair exonuclease SbcCD nuclease subunit